jgi:hypothetical protein
MRMKLLFTWIVLAACLSGCTPSAPSGNKSGDGAKKGEDEVKLAFAALQSAVKAKDADKIWDLLGKNSQADAEREATAAKEAYGKLADADKAGYEKRLGLTSKELADITGKLYVKSEVFYNKHHEIPDSKIDKVGVTGETGTLYSIEDDGDKVNFPLVRDQGKWKFVLEIPKAPEK